MKKLYRSRNDRKISGVLGGLASYTGLDPSLLRVLFVIGLIFSFGTFALIYGIWMFVVPTDQDVAS